MHLDGEHWLIKLPSHRDLKDIGAIEYAYHLMAEDAGLDLYRKLNYFLRAVVLVFWEVNDLIKQIIPEYICIQ